MDDSIDGLRSACLPLAAAQEIADREIATAGLAGWTTASGPGQTDGRTTCTYSLIEADRQQVVLIPVDGLMTPGDNAPHVQMAATLRERIRETCLSVPQAAALTRDVAAETGVEGVVVHEVPKPGAACASLDMRVGGAVEVTVRGT